jgi:hypothetical protein
MNQLQKTLSLLVLIQVVVLIGMNLSDSQPTQSNVTSMLDITADSVVKLTVKSGVAEDQAKPALEIIKKNGQWVLPSADNFGLDSKKVENVFKKFVRMNVDTPIATSKSNHNTLNVGERTYSKSVSISTAETEFELVLGEAKGRSMYVRKKAESEVYLAKGVTAFDISEAVTSYTDPEYFSVNDIKDVVIERPKSVSQARTHLYQDENGQWLVDGLQGQPIDQSRVRALLAAVRSARMVRPVGKSLRPEFGLGNPQAAVTVKGKPDIVEFLVGNTVDDFVYVKASHKEDVVLVRKYTVQALVNLDTRTLVDKGSAPQPGAAPAMPAGAPSLNPTRP